MANLLCVMSGQFYGNVATGLQTDIPDPEACQQTDEDMYNHAIRVQGYDPESE